MSRDFSLLSWRRVTYSFVHGTRFVFAGAAGGVAYRVVTVDGPVVVESFLFFALVVMVAIVEYPLITLEEGAKRESGDFDPSELEGEDE